MAETHTGGCYCGAVEIEVRGEPLEMGYCHCENCRRYSAAPVSAFTLWKPEQRQAHQRQRSSSASSKAAKSAIVVIAQNAAATSCVDHPTLGLIDVRIGALRNFPFKPKVHLNYAETVLPMKDGLPKLKRLSSGDRRIG